MEGKDPMLMRTLSTRNGFDSQAVNSKCWGKDYAPIKCRLFFEEGGEGGRWKGD
jgi:hypothetical protein